ncbi:MAG: hypothetical protein FAF03_05895 [Epsilonproteobacteria bacterium]|nr:hypothetical protein [Campylobacterota bacterium]
MQCSYCGGEIEKGIKSCPHCGTLNPSQDVKNALLWTVGMLTLFTIIYKVFY